MGEARTRWAEVSLEFPVPYEVSDATDAYIASQAVHISVLSESLHETNTTCFTLEDSLRRINIENRYLESRIRELEQEKEKTRIAYETHAKHLKSCAENAEEEVDALESRVKELESEIADALQGAKNAWAGARELRQQLAEAREEAQEAKDSAACAYANLGSGGHFYTRMKEMRDYVETTEKELSSLRAKLSGEPDGWCLWSEESGFAISSISHAKHKAEERIHMTCSPLRAVPVKLVRMDEQQISELSDVNGDRNGNTNRNADAGSGSDQRRSDQSKDTVSGNVKSSERVADQEPIPQPSSDEARRSDSPTGGRAEIRLNDSRGNPALTRHTCDHAFPMDGDHERKSIDDATPEDWRLANKTAEQLAKIMEARRDPAEDVRNSASIEYTHAAIEEIRKEAFRAGLYAGIDNFVDEPCASKELHRIMPGSWLVFLKNTEGDK